MKNFDHVDYEIRHASHKDIHAISDVLHAAFWEFKSLYTPEAFQATTPDAQIVLQRMKEGPMWVAVLNNKVVATVSAVANGKSLYVRGMAVHPLFRSMGLGQALLRNVENFALSTAYESMQLSTTPFLVAAIALYRTFGFIRSDQGPHDLFGTPLFTMTKRLALESAP
jgi:ribosomal protein S18 acetylase RimI-like enzyme